MSTSGEIAAETATTTTTENGNVTVFSGGGYGGGVSVKENSVIPQCAQFPIVNFDRRNKGLTSIIENLKVLRHQKGELFPLNH